MAKELFVGNLPWSVNDDSLKQHFADFTPSAANVVADRDSGRSRGFGFVKFEDDAKAAEAIEALNGKEIDGRPITVREATPRQ